MLLIPCIISSNFIQPPYHKAESYPGSAFYISKTLSGLLDIIHQDPVDIKVNYCNAKPFFQVMSSYVVSLVIMRS